MDKQTKRRLADHASRARKAVWKYADNEDIESSVTDILADLRHLCDFYGLDFADRDRRAYEHYICELNGEV